MSNILYKSIQNLGLKSRASLCIIVHRQQLFSHRFLSSTTEEPSFAVSYLINTCGLSQESALKASKYVNFDKADKPNNVIEFFRSHGFSHTQISNLVKRQPNLLTSDPEKSILPKIEFFRSKGVSEPEIAKLFSGYPVIMRRSLEKHIIPAFDYFKGIFRSDELVLIAAKRFMGMLTFNLEGSLVQNVRILQEYGVPEIHIYTLLKNQPRSLFGSPVRMREVVEEVKAMGFNPLRQSFVLAVHVIRSMNKTTWEGKVEAYKKWGWSEELVIQAFRNCPLGMVTSEDKIMAIMDFFVNSMGWDPSLIVKKPEMMTMSLEKRLIPRASVIKFLMSKGLVKKLSLRAFLISTADFIEKYVIPFEKEAPEVLELFKGKMDPSKT